ncbi:helix-turn-helix domain-containing protein [Christiangramia aquimixticola]|uniref:helix-turn-helix domain-containing protein n=1 Tax=Christiangramia aquimixticola TaxID=1697558 RepID=UPI003AA83A9B
MKLVFDVEPLQQISKKLDELNQKIDRLENLNQKINKRSIKELASHCGVAELTVRNWITDGKIKAKRLGRRIFIEEEEFQKALSEVKSIKYKRN